MSLLQASKYVASLPLVDIDELVHAGIRCILLDRDNTCVPKDSKYLPSDIVAWVQRAKQAGLQICLVSNNFFAAQVAQTAHELAVPKIDHALKPAPFALWTALKRMGVSRHQAVLIGDQVFTDVVAGNLAGISTILVRPQSSTDLFYTKPLRMAEHRILDGISFAGEDVQP